MGDLPRPWQQISVDGKAALLKRGEYGPQGERGGAIAPSPNGRPARVTGESAFRGWGGRAPVRDKAESKNDRLLAPPPPCRGKPAPCFHQAWAAGGAVAAQGKALAQRQTSAPYTEDVLPTLGEGERQPPWGGSDGVRAPTPLHA